MRVINNIERIYIIGAGSVGGHIALNPALYGLENTEILFMDRDPKKIGTNFLGRKIVGPEEHLLEMKEPVHVVIGAAFQKIKKRVYDKLSAQENISFPSLIAKNAWISNNVEIGKGVIVYPKTSINYGSVLGDFSILNMNCAIGHDCQIGPFASLAPGVNLGGNTTIGAYTEMGIGSATKQLITIGDHVIVGGGAMVVHDIPPHSKARGIPAKIY